MVILLCNLKKFVAESRNRFNCLCYTQKSRVQLATNFFARQVARKIVTCNNTFTIIFLSTGERKAALKWLFLQLTSNLSLLASPFGHPSQV